jgi:MFS family permease
MLVSNVGRAILVGVIAALVLSGHAALWQLYILAGTFGLVDAVFYPAANTILPMIVDEPALPAANALMQGSQQLASLLGPAVAGVVVALFQTGIAFAVNAASFAISAVALWLVPGGRRPTSRPPADSGPANVIASVLEGLRYAGGSRAVRSLVLLTAATNFAFNGPLLVGVPYMADHSLGGGSATFGLLFSAYGGGAVLGAIVAGRRVSRVGTIIVATALAMGIALAILGVATSVGAAAVLLVAIGLGAGFLNVQIFSWLQARTPPDMRGRVISIVYLGAFSLSPISYALAGALVDTVPIVLVFASAGTIVTLASLFALVSGLPNQLNDRSECDASLTSNA